MSCVTPGYGGKVHSITAHDEYAAQWEQLSLGCLKGYRENVLCDTAHCITQQILVLDSQLFCIDATPDGVIENALLDPGQDFMSLTGDGALPRNPGEHMLFILPVAVERKVEHAGQSR